MKNNYITCSPPFYVLKINNLTRDNMITNCLLHPAEGPTAEQQQSHFTLSMERVSKAD